MSADRKQIKWAAILRRGGPAHATCDRCDARLNGASELHEIFNRAFTLKDSRARDLAYDERLCSLLCSRCHHHFHNRDASWEERAVLLRRNYVLYGYNQVADAFEALQHSLKVALPFVLPKPEGE